MRLLILATFIIFLTGQIYGQRKQIQATRISTPIKIDGRLDDDAWSMAEIATDFTQFEPVPYTTPTEKSEVKIVYDNKGVYVGAHMYQDPSSILKELSQRDSRGNTDWFGFVVDPYNAGVGGFAFVVTASGVQQDLQYTSEGEDINWDAVWKSAVTMTDDGWVVELMIPYAALRFPKKDIQEWGLQLSREIRNIRENIFWNPLDPKIDGFVNQCGLLRGIENIKSPVRLSLTPFIVGYFDHNSASLPGEKTSISGSAGMDLKYGINDAFTLDMTLIPDFGQVVSDNVVVNLGPFEQFFEENRAFFTEGTDLFNKGNLFYTRRIGGRPVNRGNAFVGLNSEESIVSNPTTTPLLNATKVSGRTSKGTGIGVFNAVVGEEYATIENALTGETRDIKTNPYTNYNVFVVDQNLANNSVVSVINTNTTRLGEDYDANVTGVFFDVRNKSQLYGVNGKLVLSQKYFNDAPADLGHTYRVEGGKIGGNFQAIAGYTVETENYDHNDLGILFSPNERSMFVDFRYTDFKPKNQKLLRWRVNAGASYERLYKPNKFANFAIGVGSFLVTKSRLGTGLNFNFEPIATNDFFEPRTADFSKFYLFPTNWSGRYFISTDYRKPLAVDFRVAFRNFSEEGRHELIFELEPRVRFTNKLSLFGTLTVGTLPNQLGFVNANIVDDGIDSFTFGDDVLFGRRDRAIFDNSLRLSYIFTNNMALSLRVRHYWDQFTYNKFVKLAEDGSLVNLAFDGTNDEGDRYYDANTNIFNIDLFYTWRFAPGSDIVFAWKNAVFTQGSNTNEGYFTNLSNTLGADQFNSLSLRIIYFLDYNSLIGSKI